ncbi:hypothetical protein [Microbulbifer halophilus]|uniref:Lipoprotein n=1 Tax=Microbulbifer halophilus TaxID=453963 RepID=A0ABW5EET1_9GAMM|nr:hypothetical protein [Microbulbifer halophilus]MCW8127114.1 hypothetical protein [Microbulbifer halophilus]
MTTDSLRTATLVTLLLLLVVSACGKSDASTQVQIILPEDIAEYRQVMAEYAQVGGKDPFPSVRMVKRPFQRAGKQPVAAALTQRVARTILENRPQAAKLVYFRRVDNTAYVVLAMDENAWAGISATIAAVRPLITLNLKQFPDIDKVVFGRPPGSERGDTKNGGEKPGAG